MENCYHFLRETKISRRNRHIPKACDDDFLGRFREVVADPVNQKIERHPLSGHVEDGLVYLHNGHRVPISGEFAYYDSFSEILIINRGVHEPLEEYCFQEILKILPEQPIMLELGAYWAHYSMWLKLVKPKAKSFMVEPELSNLNAGIENFARHGYNGYFIKSFVSKESFKIDDFFDDNKIEKLDILHADIQGYELEMIQCAEKVLLEKKIDYLFISTHSQELHMSCEKALNHKGYNVVVSADFENDTTSYDGFILAINPILLFKNN